MARAKVEPPPKPKMPMSKTLFAMALALAFDILKAVFEFLVFTAPFIAGVAAKAKVGSGLLGTAAGFGAGATTAVVEAIVPGSAQAIAGLGILLAFFIGFAGWIFFLIWFRLSGVSLFSDAARFVTTFLGWLFSEIPLINVFPWFSIAIARIVLLTRAQDKKEFEAWKTRQEVARLTARAQAGEQIAANDDEWEEEEQAEHAEEGEVSDEARQAANDPDRIRETNEEEAGSFESYEAANTEIPEDFATPKVGGGRL